MALPFFIQNYFRRNIVARMKLVLKGIIQNLDMLLALTQGIIAFFVGVFGGSIEVVLAITSGTLATLAFSLLRDRNKSEDMKAILERIGKDTALPEKVILIKTPDVPSITDIIESAKSELDLLFRSGTSLRVVFPQLQEAVERGCKIRVILCDQDEAIIKLLAFKASGVNDPELVRAELKQNTARLSAFVNNLSNSPNQGKMQAKLIAYIPAVGICISDPADSNGKVFAQIGTFRSHLQSAPAIKITRVQDQGMFEFFTAEFESFWNMAQPLP